MSHPNDPNWITIVLSFFGGGLIGSILSALVSHHFSTKRDITNENNTRARERLNRFNHFRGELSRWRCQFYREKEVYEYYKNVTGDIAYECGVFAPYVENIPKMNDRLLKLYSFKRNEVDAPSQSQQCQNLVDHIEAIIKDLKAVS